MKELCLDANCSLPQDVWNALVRRRKMGHPPRPERPGYYFGKYALPEKKMPLCQDTGMVVVFAEVGQDVHIQGGLLQDAVDEGVRQAYEEGYFRKSVVGRSLERVNTKDNTPAVLHVS